MKRKFLKVTAVSAFIAAMSAIPASAAGFVSTAEGIKYQWGDGAYCTNNWVHYRDHWFYFGSDQLMRTGWIQRDDTWYYAADTGELQAGIMKINGNVYYFDKVSCKMVTGNHSYDMGSYNFTENGVQGESPYVYETWDSYGKMLVGSRQSVR